MIHHISIVQAIDLGNTHAPRTGLSCARSAPTGPPDMPMLDKHLSLEPVTRHAYLMVPAGIASADHVAVVSQEETVWLSASQ